MSKEIEKIFELSKVKKDGFTVDLEGNEINRKKGYVIALNETQNSFGYAGLVKAYNVAKSKGIYVGGWFEEEEGLYYFDASVIVETEKEARRLARKEKQKAYFNLENGKSIKIK